MDNICKLFPASSKKVGQVVTPALISINGGIVRGFCPARAGKLTGI